MATFLNLALVDRLLHAGDVRHVARTCQPSSPREPTTGMPCAGNKFRKVYDAFMIQRPAAPSDLDSASPATDPQARDESGGPRDWLEALEQSEAQLAAGETVDGAEVLRRLDESIARIKARKAAKRIL